MTPMAIPPAMPYFRKSLKNDALRRGAFIARFGGDEFAMILRMTKRFRAPIW